MKPVKITKHAAIKISDRTHLSQGEMQSMLAEGKYYPVGIDGKKEHIHKIIYSPKDDQLFVVVEDHNNHDIITLLPLDYHNSWKLDIETLDKIVRQYLGAPTNEDYIIPSPQKVSVSFNFISRSDPSISMGCKIGYTNADELLCMGIQGLKNGKLDDIKACKQSLEQNATAVSELIDELVSETLESNPDVFNKMQEAKLHHVSFSFGGKIMAFYAYAIPDKCLRTTQMP